ncbi:MAG: DUF4392 domain-containing protein [Euryarchaeota archaeon]|nr:DUF4392 domain-containing protein [Euryarchaeota archaeon]
MTSSAFENFSEAIDRLVCLDLASRNVTKLYDAARAISKNPLCFRAASRLAELPKNSTVLVATGFTILPNQTGETDGPSGCAVFANALSEGLGINTVFLSDPHLVKIVQAPLKVFGLESPVIAFPFENPKEFAEEIITQYKPSALVAVERPGWNIKGIYHNMRGIDISNFTAKIDFLFEMAQENKILTIGIGDGGNEIGMGNVEETVREAIQFGEKCICPCQSGIASSVKTDELVVAGVSNWGAYGVVTMLSALLKQNLIHSDVVEENMTRAMVDAGAVDGITKKPELSVDGLPVTIHGGLVNLFQKLLRL